MKRTTSVATFLAAAALALPAFAQDKAPAKDAPKPAAPAAKPADAKPAAKPADAAPAAKPADKPAAPAAGGMPPEMMAAMMPGEHHAKLKPFEGKWNCVVKAWMSPDPAAPPMESKVTTVYAWVLDGRYLTMDVNGEFGGMPFKGMGVLGYNNAEKRYESGWIDNFGTGVATSHGQMDTAGKALTMTSEMLDPMSGQRVKAREVITWTGPDSFKQEFFKTPAGGKEAKDMEITCTRAK